MSYRRKYRKGAQVKSEIAMLLAILEGRPLYFNHKIQNKGWLMGMQLHTLCLFAKGGNVWYAVENEVPR